MTDLLSLETGINYIFITKVIKDTTGIYLFGFLKMIHVTKEYFILNMLNERVIYNPWPLPIDETLMRPELKQLKEAGYEFGDAREVVDLFEKKVAAFAGSKYAVAVDCCTHAIELSLIYRHLQKRSEPMEYVRYKDRHKIPANTYISIPQTIVGLGDAPVFCKSEWLGIYEIGDTGVIDAAVRWKENMYVSGTLYCLSFQIKKPIPIGRGGMILTDDKEAYEWLKLARYDGRDMSLPYDHPEHVKMMGYHYYLTPEDCARGILLMDKVTFRGDSANWSNYPDVSKYFK